MKKMRWWGIATLCALLLGGLAGLASANKLSSTSTRFRTTYSPFTMIPSFGEIVRCPVTFEGSFHSATITKTAGSLIGYVTNVIVGSCVTGRAGEKSASARANTETLPWHRQYTSFTGTLPNIGSVISQVLRMSFEIQGGAFGLRVTCRYDLAAEPLI